MIKKIKIAIVMISIGFMLWLFQNQWVQYRELDWNCDLRFLFLSFFLLVIIFFLDAIGWHFILKMLGQNISLYQSIRIWILSSLTRYLPGGIWPYASRAALSKEIGISVTVCSVSLYLEMVLLILSSLGVGLPALIGLQQISLHPGMIILLFALCIIFMHPKFILLLRFIPGKFGDLIKSVALPSIKQLTLLYFFYVSLWLFFGCVFVVFAHAFYPIPRELWFQLGSTLSFSFCVGFAIVIIPGGIGVRESILYLFLAPYLPEVASTLIAIGSRLWIILGELFALMLVWIMSYSKKGKLNNS